MSKLILASHGSLAEGMRSALKMILGESCEASAYGLDTWEQPQNILEEIKKLRKEFPEEEFIVLCDIKGGSVCNCMMQLCEDSNICVISGMNLGLAIGLSMIPEGMKCADMIDGLMEEAKAGMEYFDSSVINHLNGKEGEDELW